MSLLERLGLRRPGSGISYWEERARKLGARAVCNIGHDDSEFNAVTERQLSTLLPLLDQQLCGEEKLAVDFGCGSGRFTLHLADRVKDRVVAVDPVASLIALAPPHERVEYHLLGDGRIPVSDASADIVWVCLVLGTITDRDALTRSVNEIERVLAPGGLLFLVENTVPKKNVRHFHFRTQAQYESLFASVPLQVSGAYEDLGETITVFAGRRA